MGYKPDTNEYDRAEYGVGRLYPPDNQAPLPKVKAVGKGAEARGYEERSVPEYEPFADAWDGLGKVRPWRPKGRRRGK